MESFIILDIIDGKVLVKNTTINDICFNCSLEEHNCNRECVLKGYFLSEDTLKRMERDYCRVYEIEDDVRFRFILFMDEKFRKYEMVYTIIDINEHGILVENNLTSQSIMGKSCFRCRFDHNTCQFECMPNKTDKDEINKSEYIKTCKKYYLPDIFATKLFDGDYFYKFKHTNHGQVLKLSKLFHDIHCLHCSTEGMTGTNGPDDSLISACSVVEEIDKQKISHNDLIKKGARWLKKHHENVSVPNCSIVALELSAPVTKEIPDIIGWCSWCSVMIEVKVNRADFAIDFLKPSRKELQGVGELRFYLCPENLLTSDEIPEPFGLLYYTKDGIKIIKNATRQSTNMEAERNMLTAYIRQNKK